MINKATKILAGTMLVYLILVATHDGEFWPFSIYPMFSKAGRPWQRVIVRDVTGIPDSTYNHPINMDRLPGLAVPLNNYGIETIDLADYINKTESWNNEKIHGIRSLLGEEHFKNKKWLIVKVHGQLSRDGVNVTATPFLLLEENSNSFISF
ncbi:hypothetical protein K1X84_08455 [bacterium]|nr:hypothetical protein [bacterium]